MNKMFTQPTGPVAKQVNRQTLARIWGQSIKDTVYLNAYTSVTGSVILFDADTGSVWYTGNAKGIPLSWSVGVKSLTLVTDSGSFTCWPAI